MKLKSIKVGYTIPGGNYDNIRIDYEADLEPWEDEQQTILHLRRKCLEAAKNAGFRVSDYEDSETQLNKINEGIERQKEEVKKAKAELHKVCEELSLYKDDLKSIRKMTEAINCLRDWNIYSQVAQVRETYLLLADRHPNLFKERSKEEESGEYDPIPFEGNNESVQEDEEEEDDEDDAYF